MNTYIQNINNTFQTNHVFFFAIVIFLLQIISIFFKPYSINIDGPSSIMTAYVFINTPLSIYQLIMSGIVSTSISYFIYKLSLGKLNNILYNILTFISVLTTMILLNCLSMPALAYSLLSYVNIPKNKFNYLSSYIISSVIIMLLCILLLFIFKGINKHTTKSTIFNSNFQQLEQNIQL